MTAIWTIACALVLCCTLAAGWLLTLLGMPGNWLIVAAAAVYALIVPADSSLAISGWAVLILAGLALGGELIELTAGALGVAKAGGSRRSAVLALLGSVIGGFGGLFVGLPLPVVGPPLAALLFASLGAMAGAMLGESWKGRGLDQSVEVGKAAFWGRLLGTLAKTLIGSIMCGVTLAALVLSSL
jgi:uncharacterized protein